MRDIDPVALDNYTTGHYGEDQNLDDELDEELDDPFYGRHEDADDSNYPEDDYYAEEDYYDFPEGWFEEEEQ
jgi:hypothetical protein